ncbi:RNA polymerase sigma factor [Eubacterium sp.]|uniref:RNA polymerase sigma factor n=1 Tax=Eubacterium sp. TaxID=142586 RepID=UPI0025E63B20|nr:RNA polymerase sigma factor [Eubacterium sp.]MCR5630061.1 RNA polymerase sigma factor [Eubacterium sp.]
MSENSLDMDAIYRKYCLPLKKYIISICRNDVLADDIVSETFYKAIVNIDSFKGGNLYAWLCTIAKNTYFNHVKKKENLNISLDDKEYLEVKMSSSTEEKYIEREEKRELRECIESLSEVEKEVVKLRTYSGLSFKEIGTVLHKSENWARVTYYRSKEKLKGMMESEEKRNN